MDGKNGMDEQARSRPALSSIRSIPSIPLRSVHSAPFRSVTTLSAMPAPGTIVRFLSELRATGMPVIRLRGQGDWRNSLLLIETEASNEPEISRILAAWHEEAADDLGGPPLPFDEPAALRGARLLFRAAWCYLQRDTGKDEVARLLLESSLTSSQIPPSTHSASAQFSADLTLQHLPALFRMAQVLAPGDPLLAALRELAHEFPLSGIGIQPADPDTPPSADPEAWENLHAHPGLQQLFLDRILSSQARPWTKHPAVAQALRHTLGEYARELAPTLEPPGVPASEK